MPPAILKRMESFDRITWNPAVMGGQPCIRGIRMNVGTIVGLLVSRRADHGRSVGGLSVSGRRRHPSVFGVAAWRVQV